MENYSHFVTIVAGENPIDLIDKHKNNENELFIAYRYDDAEEIKAMFEGIELGTEATRSSIIENAINSNYILLKDNVYYLQPMGKYYVETLDKLHIMMPKEKTAEIGRSLKKYIEMK